MSKQAGQNAPEGYVVISEAIRLSGIARSTFYEYMQAGKISVSTLNFKGKDRKFIDLAELLRVFGDSSGVQTKPDDAGQNKSESENVHEQSELVRLRTENAVLQARLEEVREAQRIAERDKENLTHLLAKSVDTVRFLELRSTETAQLLELRHDSPEPGQPGQDEKKPGFFSRLFKK